MSQNINELLENDENVENLKDIKEINVKEHIISHCRTKLNFKNFDYTWNITDFSVTCRAMNSSLLLCKTGDQPFIITASFIEQTNTLCFGSLFESSLEKQIKVNYYCYIQTTDGIRMPLIRKNIYLKHNQVIYEISFKNLYEQKSTYLPNDTLTVCFQFEIIESFSCNYINQTIVEREESAYLDTILMTLNKSNSFVTFVIDDKQLYINKDLLYSKSDVFKAMFNSELEESNTDIIKISAIKYDVFKYLIFYMENGNLGNLKMNADINYTETLYDLIIAAEKYNIKDLKYLCENLLIKNTSKDNVIGHLNIAHLNNASFLEQYTIKFLKLYENILIETSDFKMLIRKFPELITKIMEVNLDSKIYVYE